MELLECARKKYLQSKQEYFDLLDNFYTTHSHQKLFDYPDVSKSSLDYTSLLEAEKSTCSNDWPIIPFDQSFQAVEFFLSIQADSIQKIKSQHNPSDLHTEGYGHLVASILFPQFISFFNSSFAPINNLPLNSIRPDTFLKACTQLLDHHQHS